MAHRQSTFSNASGLLAGNHGTVAPTTTSALISALHTSFQTGAPYQIDASTSLVVVNALAGGNGGGGTMMTGVSTAGHEVIDTTIPLRAWEHARRRAEDQCVLVSSISPSSTPSLLVPLLSTLPEVSPKLLSVLNTVRPFLVALTPYSPQTPLHHGLTVTQNISLTGHATGCSIALTSKGIDVKNGLLQIPAQVGYRAFDVFYYLLSSTSSPQEREYLSLERPDKYDLLKRSGTYSPPAWHPTADDAASAEDFRQGLREIGIKGSMLRGVLSVLAGLLKLGNTISVLTADEEVEELCEDIGGLLGLEPEVLVKVGADERARFINVAYHALVNWIIHKANAAMDADFAAKRQESSSAGSEGDTVAVSFMEVADEAQAKSICMKLVFDDDFGINAEMKEDGVEVAAVNSAVLREMKQAIDAYEGDSSTKREEEYEKDREAGIVEKIGREVEAAGFLKQILFPEEHDIKIERLETVNVLQTSRVWNHIALSPTDPGAAQSQPAAASTPSMSLTSNTAGWSAAAVSKQVRSWRLMEWGNRRNRHLDFTADFDFTEFSQRYAPLGCQNGRDGVESWVIERGWSNGEVVVGKDRVWMREGSWWEVELMLDVKPEIGGMMGGGFVQTPASFGGNLSASGYFPQMPDGSQQGSRDNLLVQQQASTPSGFINRPMSVAQPFGETGLIKDIDRFNPNAKKDLEIGSKTVVKEEQRTFGRKIWVGFVWAMTFWMPSFLLKLIGRMKRPDVRLAWREKFVLFFLIILLNAGMAFFLIGLGIILCPDKEKVWDLQYVGYQVANPLFWVAIRGNVYDITKFYKQQHSDINIETTADSMKPFAGMDLTPFFPIPLSVGCPGLVKDDGHMFLTHNDTAYLQSGGFTHVSGPSQAVPTSKLRSINWYRDDFAPRIREYYKGDLIWSKKRVNDEGQNDNHMWFIYDGNVYDLTDYFYTLKFHPATKSAGAANYDFLAPGLKKAVQQNAGQDLTEDFPTYFSSKTQMQNNLNCLKQTFYIGRVDFRDSPKCLTQPYILLAFAIVLCAVIIVKFLAALQLGTKRRPAMQDKFVICQIPCYTEGEESLRKSLDSLTALDYENKRKLIFVICDGMVVGGGNDKSTPQIVLDILGVDPKVDPPALPFKSVGEGSQQLNYGKVYSGLYEFEGRVVPYVVVVKVGKPTETSKPGNRGKRDSQITVMSFLNRVHHRSPMNPLELELFHQINNVIGVDPELYEYMLMVDADTAVREDSLNRLVASCANNSKIAGICGETNLENEGRSWWTMIQVYEYYISHHLAKSFESLFGSVTCLPGCFSMYRLRTADKGKPLIISSKVIEEYADGQVDTLHKKNLLSLGEDRFLTTLMTKHFPQMSYKFVPDAYAATAAPESWSVLLSQRRRWINSTIHNLIELMFLKDMCGFCLFSMRFVVFIDLIGTILLPTTIVYIGYLIYIVATPGHAFPIISLAMLAGVYGLQAIIFIIKRQWQHIGWMIIYLLALPIYSFILPIYSFWKQDDFSWGNTRIVVGESGDKKLVATEDEIFDPASIPLQTWDEYATINNLPGRRSGPVEKQYEDNGGYEMDDMQSVYSSAKPASTIHLGANPYLAPIPSPLANRQSSYSTLLQNTSGHLSMQQTGGADYWQEGGAGGAGGAGGRASVSPYSTPGPRLSRSPLSAAGYAGSRPASSVMDFQRALNGPDNNTIAEVIRECLASVDLDSVTKKQVRALVEQRLQTELTGERRQFLDKQIDIELANM